MQATIVLVDKYKKVCALASDNACAGSLGVTRATVSRWRNGQGHPEADSVERMCIAIGEPLRAWLPLVEAERARSPAVRKVWLRLAQAAASIAVAFLLAQALGFSAHNMAGVYIMSITVTASIMAGFAYLTRRNSYAVSLDV